jgi:hypothetical protein
MSTHDFPLSAAGVESLADAGVSEASTASLASTAKVPWYLWTGALAVSCSTYGLEWDIAWHDSIGRDTFWTPAHMLIYLCGVLSGVTCGYLVLATTFGRSPELRANSVTVFGFRAPLGGFMATWGGLAMLVSAPFDNWWHYAYGLDVAVITPPHSLLLIGVDLIAVGFLLLIAGAMNRAAQAGAASFKTLRLLFLYVGGLIAMMHMLGVSQLVERTWLHSSAAYKDVTVAVAVVFALVSQASGHRWAATCAASVYTFVRIAVILIFPLFPAVPKLGPVLNPLTHFMPLQFPILIIVPAIALDLLRRRTGGWKPWQDALVCGVTFVATLVPVEWFFADFLNTPAAANRFFGTMYFDYWTSAKDRLPHFSRAQSGWPLMHGLLVVTLFAIVASWIGLRVGRWVQTVQR